MSFLVRGQRDVVSLESPVQWPIEGARQVGGGEHRTQMEETLRSVVAVRPEVLVLFSACRTGRRPAWPRSSRPACW